MSELAEGERKGAENVGQAPSLGKRENLGADHQNRDTHRKTRRRDTIASVLIREPQSLK
jgi:hypothetical protein